jgi:two-component system, OmpR family, phosphate regulon response regulator PhoB
MSSQARILIVDDEPAIRKMVSLMLSLANHDCLEVADTAEAQKKILAEKPDLILLDWMLPSVSDKEKILKLTLNSLSFGRNSGLSLGLTGLSLGLSLRKNLM